MGVYVLIAVYCVLIAAASLIGGLLPNLLRLTHVRMQLILSLVGGLMLGVGLLHMLPHAVAAGIGIDAAIGMTLVGILVMFFMIRAFHFHHHEPLEEGISQDHDHDHDHAHDHDHDHDAHGPAGKKTFNWVGIFLGLALHTLIDGVALAAAVQAEASHAQSGVFFLFGLGVFLAILLHKPLDALSITTLMTAGGWSPRWRHIANVSFFSCLP